MTARTIGGRLGETVLRHGRRPARSEDGFALVAVLMLLAFGGLLLPPLLNLVSTSFRMQQVHETSLQDFYAADAAVEDALWQIKANELSTLFPDYDEYAYSASYAYSSYPDTATAVELNGTDVEVIIENVWIPDSIDAPTASEAQERIDDAILVVTGTVDDGDTYCIRLTYNYQESADPDWDQLKVDHLCIWLPPGFTYVEDSSNLEDDVFADYYCVPSTEPYKGGQAVVWEFDPDVLFIDMPGVSMVDYPLSSSVTFDFAAAGGGMPDAAVAWLTTTGVSDVDYAWDADVRVFRIRSVATDPHSGASTTIDAYTAREELRHISAAIPGDYYAMGNSLLTPTGDVNYRDRLYKESSATIPTDDSGDDGIPTQGIPEAAYLYWTGWIDWHDYDPEPLFYDDCHDSQYWDSVGWSFPWNPYWRSYAAFSQWNNSTRTLTLRDSLDLSACEPGTVTLSWNQSGSTSYLRYAFSDDGGESWSTYTSAPSGSTVEVIIPADYLTDGFKVRFHFNTSTRYRNVYVDNIMIAGPGSTLEYPDEATAENLTALIEDAARTNVVLFEAGGADPAEVTADAWEIEPTTGTEWEGTWSYCCVSDVTDLIRQWIEDGDLSNNAGGTYTLGHKVAENEADPDFSFQLYVPSGPNEQTGYPLGTPAVSHSTRYQYSHCGWSLIVIYTSPETYGHQLYLFDIRDPDFNFTEAWGPSGNPNPDFDGDGDPGGRIAGFLVPEPIEDETIAAKMTVFVGEGDSTIDYDRAQLNGAYLSNSASPWNNVWNSESPGMSIDGVDIDTFVIEWDDDILETGDTQAQVDLPTRSSNPSDGFNLVYIILSFRSDVTTGGTISFLLAG